jgi:micrococcal nuclease
MGFVPLQWVSHKQEPMRIVFLSRYKFALTPSSQTWRMRRDEPSSHAPTTRLEVVSAGTRSLGLLVAFFNPPDPGVTSGEFEFVQRVVDGDALLLGTGERVRLIGVNTPETVHPKEVEAFGKEASAFTKRIVEGKLVRLEFDPLASRGSDGKDRYSRTLAYVFLQDGTHLNAEIIRQGYGFAVTGSPPLKYQNEFRRLELEAREQRRGLWASH